MPFQTVEYEFPDENDATTVEVEIEGNVNERVVGEEEPPEIEVVDDVPVADRGRIPSTPPDAITEEELATYSTKHSARLRHFSKGYNDERRVKEQAQRDRDEAINYAKAMVEENHKLRGTVSKGQATMLEQAKLQVNTGLDDAKRAYKLAYEAGDSEGMLVAQTGLTNATLRADKVNSFRLPETPLQPVAPPVQPRPNIAAPDDQAVAWSKKNTWFGDDEEMTAFALGYHAKLTKEGVNPQTDDYYAKLNSRMRQVFPEQFPGEVKEKLTEVRRAPNVVASATRSTAPTKIRLTASAIAMAKQLGVPIAEYAKSAAILKEKASGGE